MTLLAVVYCDVEDVERFLSVQGVTAFSDHNETGAPDDDVTHDCINEATLEIDYYCRQRYGQAVLATNDWVAEQSKVLATYFLCGRRGNTIPESLQRRVDKLYEQLQAILDGGSIPGAESHSRPAFSNLTVDRRYHRSKVRVTRTNSSDQVSKVRRHDAPDYFPVDS
jgi:phage gp36-like protein